MCTRFLAVLAILLSNEAVAPTQGIVLDWQPCSSFTPVQQGQGCAIVTVPLDADNATLDNRTLTSFIRRFYTGPGALTPRRMRSNPAPSPDK